jgi:hypothetical protein
MSERTHRITWTDEHGDQWRAEQIAGRWQLSRWAPGTGTWQPIGSYPNRAAALRAAHDTEDGGTS